MRSMFVGVPFVRFDLGRHALVSRLPGLKLGQNQTVFALDDYLSKIEGIADSGERDRLKKKYEECKAKDLTSTEGVGCLAALAVEVYDVLKNQDSSTPLPPPAPVPPPAKEFPIVPVAIAVVAAGGLIWFLASRGKKK